MAFDWGEGKGEHLRDEVGDGNGWGEGVGETRDPQRPNEEWPHGPADSDIQPDEGERDADEEDRGRVPS